MTNFDFHKDLESRLGHSFQDPNLLIRALTHASTGREDNERLEFLGDAVLNLVVSEALHAHLPTHHEGALTELRGALVSRATLKTVAFRLRIHEHLIVDESVKKNGAVPPSLGGNALEAILGAIYLDLPVAHRLDQVRRLALAWLQPEMEHLAETWGHRQAKQNLQKWCQREKGSLPEYIVLQHDEQKDPGRFLVEVRFGGKKWGRGEGLSKKEAEREAAWNTTRELNKKGIHVDS